MAESEKLSRLKSVTKLILGALLTLGLTYLAVDYFVTNFKFEKDAAAPCMEGSPQAICYNLPEDVCVKAWVSYAPECRAELDQQLGGINPTQLIGPMMNKCQKRKLEKTFHYSRQNSSAAICLEYFQGL